MNMLRKMMVFGVMCAGCAGKAEPSDTVVGTGGTAGKGGTAGSGNAGGAGGSAGGGSDAATPEGGTPPVRSDSLCDGTNDIRLLVYKAGGRELYAPFVKPFGTEFTFVDGQCRFFTGAGYALGYRTGVLTPEQAASVARETKWQYLPAIDGLGTQQCADSAVVVLTDGQHRVRWGCPGRDRLPGTDVTAPAAELQSLGQLLDGPLLVVAALTPPPPSAAVEPWPLASDPSTFLPADGGDHWTSPGVRVTSTVDVELLRQLRAKGAAVHSGSASDVVPTWVRGADAGVFAVYIRDDVPEPMRSAVEAIWANERL